MATIADIKELVVTETPLVLFECLFPNGTIERWSTHRVQYSGETFEPRVLGHTPFQMQAGSDDAIDSISRISLTLANADSHFSQISRNPGWKGARLSASFVFFDIRQSLAVSESLVLFRGTLNPPDEVTESILRITVTNRLNLQRVLLPSIRIQRRCPWAFPSTPEQRLEAIDGGGKGRYSPFYACGYSADLVGGRGNMNGAQPFTSCEYTRNQCIERGMFSTDEQIRDTRRFGGIEYVPTSILVRGYGESGMRAASVVDNEARYNDFVPLVYGTAWLQAPVVTARNDGNLTHMEALLGSGEISKVLKVVVNDAEIPMGAAGTDMTQTGWFNLITPGTATGSFNLDFRDSNGKPVGDPYGSFASISVVVPNRVSDGTNTPKIAVLLEGLKLPTYDLSGAYTGDSFSSNPAWIILDILRRSGWQLEELDVPSFARTAQYCDEAIASTDLYGNPVLISRYACNLAVRRRRSAADLLRGVRNCAGLYLAYGALGLLELRAEEKLAIQQSTKASGSNSVVPLSGGWPAYEFGDGSDGFSGIVRRETGESSVRLWHKSNADSPNRYTLEFQDEFNEYQQDSLSLVDIDDAIQSGHETSALLPAAGIPNFHQAARLIRRQIGKSIRGNLYVQFETSVRSVGLRPGDIITITYLKEGFLRQPFRIHRIAPGINHRTALIEAQVHDDAWYTDSSTESGEVRRRQGRWGTGVPRPLVGSELDGAGFPQFGIAEEHEMLYDGTIAVRVTVSFHEPSKPALGATSTPHVSLAPVLNPTGGTLAGGMTLYYAVSAVDSTGSEGPLSFSVAANIPVGTNTNTVTISGLKFSAGTASFHVYRGSSPSQILRIAEFEPLASSFHDVGLTATLTGPPDENFDHAKFQWRRELQPEVMATLYSSSTIGNDGLTLVPNEFAGMAVRITQGTGAGQERIIATHDTYLLTLASRWQVPPDATSRFVIVESTWNFGGTGVSSPVQWTVPNQSGLTIHVSGTAVNARGVESMRDLSPMTRWQIGGSTGGSDADIPPIPFFGVSVPGPGSIEVVGVGFADLTNTRTIHSGTLTFHYVDELSGATPYLLPAELDPLSTSATVSGVPLVIGDMLQIDSEIVEIEAVSGGGIFTVRRGSHNSVAATHGAGTLVFRLARKVQILAFPRDFFGSPASGSFSFPVRIPNIRLAAAELFVTNPRGNSETAKISFTDNLEQGIRTHSGGQFAIQVDGNLAIQAGAAPPLIVETTHSIRDIHAVVAEAPTGAPVELAIRVDDLVLCALTIPVGQNSSNVVDGFGLAPLAAMAKVGLDILSVGNGVNTRPGRDLTVTIRL